MKLTDESKLFGKIERIISGEYDNLECNNKVDNLYYYYNDCISIKDLRIFLASREKDIDSGINKFLSKLYYKINTNVNIGFVSSYEMLGYNSNTDEVCIRFFKRLPCDPFLFKYKKDENENLVVNNSNLFCDSLSTLFKKDFIKIYDFMKQQYYEKFNVQTVNSNLNFEVCPSDCIRVFIDEDNYVDYSIKQNSYSMNINSTIIMWELMNNIETFIDNLFIGIEDCPKNMQEDLHVIRKMKIKEKEKTKKRVHKKTLVKSFKTLK